MPDAYGLALATFVFTVLGTVVGTTWRVGRLLDQRDSGLIKMIADHELADVERFAAIRSDVSDAGERIRREFGETGYALRQKMTDIELWGRDNYLQKVPFYKVTEKLSEDIQRLADKIDKQAERDTRVDRQRDAD